MFWRSYRGCRRRLFFCFPYSSPSSLQSQAFDHWTIVSARAVRISPPASGRMDEGCVQRGGGHKGVEERNRWLGTRFSGGTFLPIEAGALHISVAAAVL